MVSNLFDITTMSAWTTSDYVDQAMVQALQAAHAAGGGTVVCPAGVLNFFSPIVNPYVNVKIQGAGIPCLGRSVAEINWPHTYDAAGTVFRMGNLGNTPRGNVSYIHDAFMSIGPCYSGNQWIPSPTYSTSPNPQNYWFNQPVFGQFTTNGLAGEDQGVSGVLLDCNNLCDVGIRANSLFHSDFNCAVTQANLCGYVFTSVPLQAATNATPGYYPFSNNDFHNNTGTLRYIDSRPFFTSAITQTPHAGDTTLCISTGANLVNGMYVTVGAGKYQIYGYNAGVVQVGGGGISAADAALVAAGQTTCAFAGQALFLGGMPATLYPSNAVYQISQITDSTKYFWCGNACFNKFDHIEVVITTASAAVEVGFSDHNWIDRLVVYNNGPGLGLQIDGGNTKAGTNADTLRVGYFAGKAKLMGTGDGYSYPASNIFFANLDTGDNPYGLSKGTGANGWYATDINPNWTAL